LLAKLDSDDICSALAACQFPLATGVPLRTSGFVCLPINGKVSGVKALSCTGLPTGIIGDWTDQFDGVGVLAVDQVVSIYVSSIHSMFCWWMGSVMSESWVGAGVVST
jgi:hypothetical protein